MPRYKVRVKDDVTKGEYSILRVDDNFFELCVALNRYVNKFQVKVIDGYLIDGYGDELKKLHFLSYEIKYQFFFTSAQARLRSAVFERDRLREVPAL
jgi:hypothetical protein